MGFAVGRPLHLSRPSPGARARVRRSRDSGSDRQGCGEFARNAGRRAGPLLLVTIAAIGCHSCRSPAPGAAVTGGRALPAPNAAADLGPRPAPPAENRAEGENGVPPREDASPGSLPSGEEREEGENGGEDAAWQEQRERMVATQIAARDVTSPEVLRAMRSVPRHRFVPAESRDLAYADTPLPIGHDQTISQPYIVAVMTQLADVRPGDRVLEVGTGSGYQAAVLAELGAEVFTIEIVEPLAERARRTLDELGYGTRIHTRVGDGYFGWPEQGPFAAVLVTAAPPAIPPPLLEQLAVGGRLVAPVGDEWQELVVLEKQPDGRIGRRTVFPVSFVPMTGEAQRRRHE